MVLYHVSPVRVSILDPLKATSTFKAVWLVDGDRLQWALQHVSDTKGMKSSELWIHVIRFDDHSFLIRRRKGVFFSRQPLTVSRVWPCKVSLVENSYNRGKYGK